MTTLNYQTSHASQSTKRRCEYLPSCPPVYPFLLSSMRYFSSLRGTLPASLGPRRKTDRHFVGTQTLDLAASGSTTDYASAGDGWRHKDIVCGDRASCPSRHSGATDGGGEMILIASCSDIAHKNLQPPPPPGPTRAEYARQPFSAAVVRSAWSEK